jgi:hypothetical protein
MVIMVKLMTVGQMQNFLNFIQSDIVDKNEKYMMFFPTIRDFASNRCSQQRRRIVVGSHFIYEIILRQLRRILKIEKMFCIALVSLGVAALMVFASIWIDGDTPARFGRARHRRPAEKRGPDAEIAFAS